MAGSPPNPVRSAMTLGAGGIHGSTGRAPVERLGAGSCAMDFALPAMVAPLHVPFGRSLVLRFGPLKSPMKLLAVRFYPPPCRSIFMFFRHSFFGARKITKKTLLCPTGLPKRMPAFLSHYKTPRLPRCCFSSFLKSPGRHEPWKSC